MSLNTQQPGELVASNSDLNSLQSCSEGSYSFWSRSSNASCSSKKSNQIRFHGSVYDVEVSWRLIMKRIKKRLTKGKVSSKYLEASSQRMPTRMISNHLNPHYQSKNAISRYSIDSDFTEVSRHSLGSEGGILSVDQVSHMFKQESSLHTGGDKSISGLEQKNEIVKVRVNGEPITESSHLNFIHKFPTDRDAFTRISVDIEPPILPKSTHSNSDECELTSRLPTSAIKRITTEQFECCKDEELKMILPDNKCETVVSECQQALPPVNVTEIRSEYEKEEGTLPASKDCVSCKRESFVGDVNGTLVTENSTDADKSFPSVSQLVQQLTSKLDPEVPNFKTGQLQRLPEDRILLMQVKGREVEIDDVVRNHRSFRASIGATAVHDKDSNNVNHVSGLNKSYTNFGTVSATQIERGDSSGVFMPGTPLMKASDSPEFGNKMDNLYRLDSSAARYESDSAKAKSDVSNSIKDSEHQLDRKVAFTEDSAQKNQNIQIIENNIVFNKEQNIINKTTIADNSTFITLSKSFKAAVNHFKHIYSYIWAITLVLSCCFALSGWASLSYLLKEINAYGWLCNDSLNYCDLQLYSIKLQILWSWLATAVFIPMVVLSLYYLGPRALMMVGIVSVFSGLGSFFICSEKFAIYPVGAVLISFGSLCVLLPALLFANMFPKRLHIATAIILCASYLSRHAPTSIIAFYLVTHLNVKICALLYCLYLIGLLVSTFFLIPFDYPESVFSSGKFVAAGLSNAIENDEKLNQDLNKNSVSIYLASSGKEKDLCKQTPLLLMLSYFSTYLFVTLVIGFSIIFAPSIDVGDVFTIMQFTMLFMPLASLGFALQATYNEYATNTLILVFALLSCFTRFFETSAARDLSVVFFMFFIIGFFTSFAVLCLKSYYCRRSLLILPAFWLSILFSTAHFTSYIHFSSYHLYLSVPTFVIGSLSFILRLSLYKMYKQSYINDSAVIHFKF